jgi:type I restriction enzyme S subunit
MPFVKYFIEYLEAPYNTSSGGTPSRKNPDFFTGNIKWVKTQELLNGFILDTDEKITTEALNKSSAKLFPSRTVLVAMYGATIGQLGILSDPAATNQACCAIIPKEEQTGYALVYLHFRENKTKLVNLAQGAAQNNINQQTVRDFPILMPKHSILVSFNELVRPQLELILKLQMQTNCLKNARDLLLPKLMSGESTV